MLRRERHGSAELLVIERKARGNSMNAGLTIAFREAVADLAGDRDLRAVVITGAGDKFFCAGGDIKEYGAIEDRAGRIFAVAQLLNRRDGLPFSDDDEQRFARFIASIGVIFESLEVLSASRIRAHRE